MIKAVLFDLDGTLLDRDASVLKFIADQAERLGIADKEKYIHRFIELDARGYVWKDKVYQQLLREFDIPQMTWENLLEDYLESFHKHGVPFPNLIEMLDGLKAAGHKLGLITNGFERMQMSNIQALGIADYFDCILISEREGIKKPDSMIFQKALKVLGTDPAESIYIGDHPDNDMKAAKAVGMKTMWKKDVQWESAEADHVIDDLEEVLAIITSDK
ncbi:HAD family hydrolase [Falsibacillus pallidus]|uniref:Putative hydrolase of the HAD superfamily n=1 Tax=Falsibacillus pallidus TaxID=493781 RepID=A0A370FYB8_9BACI|nr:HAD family hydrolase [Falsibacillus pallidus]RDI36455.1 putative hydrolase of the HAD superfamily [Falsibacillus pallidus]